RIAAFGIHTWHAANSITISNNLSFNNGASGIVIGNGDSPTGTLADNFLVTNNILMNNSEWGVVEEGRVGSHNTYLNNLVFGNKSGGVDIGKTAGFGSPPAVGTISSDPQFVNFQADGSGDYHLKSTSPARDHGTAQGAPTTD